MGDKSQLPKKVAKSCSRLHEISIDSQESDRFFGQSQCTRRSVEKRVRRSTERYFRHRLNHYLRQIAKSNQQSDNDNLGGRVNQTTMEVEAAKVINDRLRNALHRKSKTKTRLRKSQTKFSELETIIATGRQVLGQ